jgi:hypothetical protein
MEPSPPNCPPQSARPRSRSFLRSINRVNFCTMGAVTDIELRDWPHA